MDQETVFTKEVIAEGVTLLPGQGVTVPAGFRAAGLHSGIKRQRPDLGLIVADRPCVAAGVYTQNRTRAACVDLTELTVAKEQRLQAILCNSGNANACTPNAMTDAIEMQAQAAELLGIPIHRVAVAQTGVIGQPMPMELVREGLKRLPAALGVGGGADFALAILTTDTGPKEFAAHIELSSGHIVSIGGAAKGSGMIHPNMATMLGFLTTDAAVETEALQSLLRQVTDRTFNAITVDGDTSTNDMVLVMASGAAGHTPLGPGHPDWDRFAVAFETVCDRLARAIAADGEGATKLITVKVSEAPTTKDAVQIARTVAGSSLVKTAVHGGDANWGRILAAVGRAGIEVIPERTSIEIGGITVCRNGQGVVFDELSAAAHLGSKAVLISIRLGLGEATGHAYGCDLSPEYVRINASYRT